MKIAEYKYLYPYSLQEAHRSNDLAAWRESFRENIRCRDAIDEAIRQNFDGMYLNTDCVLPLIEEFGHRRMTFVLANTLKQLEDDGRFSQTNKAWGNETYVPPDREHNHQFCVRSHPAVVDGFMTQYRAEYAKMKLYSREYCQGNDMNYIGKVLVLDPKLLDEKYWEAKYQLWQASSGFGCDPAAGNKKVYATCLADGEKACWYRRDFIGEIKDKLLPDWAREKLEEVQEPKQEQQI